MKISEIMNGFKSRDRRLLVRVGIGALAVVLVLSAYAFNKGGSETKERDDARRSTLTFDERTFEKTIYTKTREEVEGLRKDMEGFKNEMRELLSQKVTEMEKKNRYGKADQLFPPPPPLKKDGEKKEQAVGTSPFPPPVPDLKSADMTASVPMPKSPFKERTKKGADKEAPQPKPIMVFDNTSISKEISKESKEISVHLPPSFMEANLLNGVTAPATNVGKNNPIPMLIRVNNLAVLPNNVKSHTKGCFVVAEGYGSLADERVHARLLTISCIDQKGGTLIDQKIKGFVVDLDGKEGMKGHVYAKFGQHIARVAIAGFLEGLGDAMNAGQKEFTYGVNTGVRSENFKDTDPETLSRAGVGQGIVNVAEDLQKFYLQLAEQSLPVIEVHPTKNITLVISEGVDIQIKKQETAKVELKS